MMGHTLSDEELERHAPRQTSSVDSDEIARLRAEVAELRMEVARLMAKLERANDPTWDR